MIVWLLVVIGLLLITCICLGITVHQREKTIKGLDEFLDIVLQDSFDFIKDAAKCIKALYGELNDRCYNIDDVVVRLGINDSDLIALVREEFKDECD